MSETPALITQRGRERQRYPLPLTPEELQEEIVLLSPGKPGEHLIRFTLDLDVYNQAPGQQPGDTLLPDLAFFRLLPTAEAIYLEWGERVLLVQPAQIDIRELAFSRELAPLRAQVNVTLTLVQQGAAAQRYSKQLQEWARAVGERSTGPANPAAGGADSGSEVPEGRGGIGLARDTLGGLLGRVRR